MRYIYIPRAIYSHSHAIYSRAWIWHYVNQETACDQAALSCWITQKETYNVFTGYTCELFYILSEFHGP